MFGLPNNSKIMKGKSFGTKKNLVVNIYRWNRESGDNPSIDTYHLDKCDNSYYSSGCLQKLGSSS